ncbi:MAG: hypothetical protein ACOC56_06385 [Atribacterota bacterium]
MAEPKYKIKQRQALLALAYTQDKKFRSVIDKEAKKRNSKPLELTDYLADNRNELIQLLKSTDVKLAKFTKIYEHKEMEKLKSQILKPGRLTKSGNTVLDEEYAKGEVVVWRSKDVEYYIKPEDFIKLEGRSPKVFVSQLKNISLLIALMQEQQFNNDVKEAKCEFSLSYIAKRRGYTKEEIQRGGKFFNELKQDLFTGAYTTYRIDKVVIDGNEYTAHGVPNFYTLLEPKKDHPGINWIVHFNNPWKSWALEILNGEARQFFVKDTKAIEDRHTTNRPYLFLFYMQLSKRKQRALTTMPVKIGNLLKDMKLPDKIISRPKECFKVLKECLVYFSKHYEPVPELESFNLYNDFHRTETAKLPLSISEAFENYKYEDFKSILGSIGVKDIRKTYISFRRPYKRPKRKHKLNSKEKEILGRTLNWFDGQIKKIPKEDQKSIVTMYIKKLGYNIYKGVFDHEANKVNANAVEFLTKVLPEKKKGRRNQNKNNKKDLKDHFKKPHVHKKQSKMPKDIKKRHGETV